jgi:hypothetical protein
MKYFVRCILFIQTSSLNINIIPEWKNYKTLAATQKVPEVGKVTLKINGDEALSDKSV